jgi:type I restriction-modification system DNA methylase subunit
MASERRYNNVLNIIDKRLIPNEAAKKARGEVFTPLTLVREMLFGLRKSALATGKTEVWGVDNDGRCKEEDPSNRVGGIPLDVWRDPDTKWLDPANGIGNFPVVTFYMLDHQLGHHGPSKYRGEANKKYRRKHIVENMLYMIEINKGNVNTARKIFEQMVPGATANICCADTLTMTDDKLKEVFGVNRFDVVMGNPPFNDNLQDNPVGHAQDTELWGEFVKISFSHFFINCTPYFL